MEELSKVQRVRQEGLTTGSLHPTLEAQTHGNKHSSCWTVDQIKKLSRSSGRLMQGDHILIPKNWAFSQVR